MIDFHGVILADEVAAQLADVSQRMHAAATDSDAPEVRVLVCGPPGVGKTAVMRALAEDARFTGIHAGAREVRAHYIGQSAVRLRGLFEKARSMAPALLTFDAFEHLFPKRGGSLDDFSDETVVELLMALDGIGRGGRGPAVCIAGEVVDLDRIDPAVLARIPLRIQLPSPDDECRKEILRRALVRHKVSLGANAEETLNQWTIRLRGSTGRDIEYFVRHEAEDAAAPTRDGNHLPADATPSDLVGDVRTQEPHADEALTSPGAPLPEPIDTAGESLDALGLTEPLLTQVRQSARLLRERERFREHHIALPAMLLFVGETQLALRCVRAFAADAKLPLRVVSGQIAVQSEQVHPDWLHSLLQAAIAAGPCVVAITDVEHVVPKHDASYFERVEVMVRPWTAVRRHLDAHRSASTYVPLVFTTSNVEAIDEGTRCRVVLSFELPPAAIA